MQVEEILSKYRPVSQFEVARDEIHGYEHTLYRMDGEYVVLSRPCPRSGSKHPAITKWEDMEAVDFDCMMSGRGFQWVKYDHHAARTKKLAVALAGFMAAVEN